MEPPRMTCIPPHMRERVLPHLDGSAEPERPANVPCCDEATVTTVRNRAPIFSEKTHFFEPQLSEKGGLPLYAEPPKRWWSGLWPPSRSQKLLLLYAACFTSILLYRQSPYSSNYIAPLSHTFHSECTALLTPTTTTYVDRLSKLVDALNLFEAPAGRISAAGWIAEPGPSAEYFLGGFSSRDWWLSERPFLISVTPSNTDRTKPNITLLTPEFERLRAEGVNLPEQVRPYITWVSWQEDESPYEKLIGYIKSEVTATGLDGKARSFIFGGLREESRKAGQMAHAGAMEVSSMAERGAEGSPMAPVAQALQLIRERKDEREIGLLRCANQMTLHAIRHTRRRMRIGVTESATRKILEEEMAKTGLVEGDGLVLFGENAALPHGSGTDRALGVHDLILIDAGGKWGGYVSDITRTFALPKSKIPRSHLDIWETVRRAQYAPYRLLLSSNSTLPPRLAELDITARKVISDHMFSLSGERSSSNSPDFSVFTHRLGHGIGLEGHEDPYLVQGPLGETKAQPGHVFSLEPGVYIPAGKEGHELKWDSSGISGVGVRLEDCFVITVDEEGRLGGEWLTGPVHAWGEV